MLVKYEGFQKGQYPTFQWNEHTPSQQLINIMKRDFQAPMMMSTFTVQAFLPTKMNQTNIDELMKTLCQHSRVGYQ